jgi:homoserine O-acetyltransferase
MFSTFKYSHPFQLESGETLPGFHLGYTVRGKLNADKSNVVWVFHALTANSDPAEWWTGLVGKGKLFDPSSQFIICVNMPGSCYGSIQPLDIHPGKGEPYFHDFPFFTTRDMIRAYQPLKDFLEIEKIQIGIGGSMGGQQLLEWAIEEPDLFEHIVPIATNAFHSAWGKAFNASQRHCIELDPTWKSADPEAGLNGMKVARGLALISYRNQATYNFYQADTDLNLLGPYKSESYQGVSGEKRPVSMHSVISVCHKHGRIR